jgi:hypothetical protein
MANGFVIGATKIIDAGPDKLRWNVVILSEGYQESEIGQFAIDAQDFASTLLSLAPFDRLRAAINIHRVDVASTESGAEDPLKCNGKLVGTGAKPKTFFKAKFCRNGNRRLLEGDSGKAFDVAKNRVPQVHLAVMAVNSPIHGGSGGKVATFSKAPGASNVAIHEIGHTAFGLADEYEYSSNCQESGHKHHSTSEPSQANITTNKNRNTTKWAGLIKPATAVPTTANADCAECDPQLSPVPVGTVGLFEGADYYHCRVYRPEYDCRMRNINMPFCAVCQQAIVKKLTPFLPA